MARFLILHLNLDVRFRDGVLFFFFILAVSQLHLIVKLLFASNLIVSLFVFLDDKAGRNLAKFVEPGTGSTFAPLYQLSLLLFIGIFAKLNQLLSLTW